MAIDLKFLRQQEGFKETPYIPKDSKGKPIGRSGVTVGTGVDIGQMSMAEFMALPIPDLVKQQLKPYVNKRGAEATAALALNPPTAVDKLVLEGLDTHMIETQVAKLREKFPQFDHISDEAQTVALSLNHNFGDKAQGYDTMKWIMNGEPHKAFIELTDAAKWDNPELYKRRVREANLLRSGGSYNPADGLQEIKPQGQRVQLPPEMEKMLPPMMQPRAQIPNRPPITPQYQDNKMLPNFIEKYLPDFMRKPMPPQQAAQNPQLPPATAQPPLRKPLPMGYGFNDMADLSHIPKAAPSMGMDLNNLPSSLLPQLEEIQVQAQRKQPLAISNPLLELQQMQEEEIDFFPTPPPQRYSF